MPDKKISELPVVTVRTWEFMERDQCVTSRIRKSDLLA